jgi:raffinose/stachyose/melibiose transport system substrate-binding protein
MNLYKKERKMKRILLLASLLLFALCLTAWAGGQKEPKAPAGPIAFTIWDVYNTESQHKVLVAVIQQFEKEHPNVKVDETYRELDADKAATMAALNAGAGPDILTVNNGETMMGPMVRAKYVVNLSPYSAKYGWEKNYLSPSLWDRAKYTPDGKVFGTGNLYGVPIYGELVGVYYNRDIFDQLGLKVPETLAELEQNAEKLKGAGITPIAYGAAEVWPFFQTWADILAATMSDKIGGDATQKWMSDVVIKGDPKRSFKDPGVLEAAQIIRRWADSDYFFKGFTGIKIDDAMTLFMAGKSGMFLQGSWYSGSVAEASFKAGMFAFPPIKKATGMVPQVGGMSTPLGININSKYKDLAAAFLNTMLASPEAHQLERDSYTLPPTVPADLSVAKQGTVFYDLLALWNDMNAKDRVGQYFDWTTPTMGDEPAGQELLSGKITPEQFVEKMQANYYNWVSSKK